MRILGEVDRAALTRDPKPIIGFSDITALHALALARVASIHGPVVTQLADSAAADAEALFALL